MKPRSPNWDNRDAFNAYSKGVAFRWYPRALKILVTDPTKRFTVGFDLEALSPENADRLERQLTQMLVALRTRKIAEEEAVC